MGRVFTALQRLLNGCLHTLSSRLTRWTKPLLTSFPLQTIALIRKMAKENRLWGAERMRGELLKLGIHVCKRTIQKYMRHVRTHQSRGQKWSTFLRNHASQIWACDALTGDRSVLSTALCVLHR